MSKLPVVMTAAELIAELQKYPQDTPVFIDYTADGAPVGEVDYLAEGETGPGGELGRPRIVLGWTGP